MKRSTDSTETRPSSGGYSQVWAQKDLFCLGDSFITQKQHFLFWRESHRWRHHISFFKRIDTEESGATVALRIRLKFQSGHWLFWLSFPWSLQAISGIINQSDFYCFLLNPFKFKFKWIQRKFGQPMLWGQNWKELNQRDWSCLPNLQIIKMLKAGRFTPRELGTGVH